MKSYSILTIVFFAIIFTACKQDGQTSETTDNKVSITAKDQVKNTKKVIAQPKEEEVEEEAVEKEEPAFNYIGVIKNIPIKALIEYGEASHSATGAIQIPITGYYFYESIKIQIPIKGSTNGNGMITFYAQTRLERKVLMAKWTSLMQIIFQELGLKEIKIYLFL